ncbi:MAG: DinB family protein [Anaerolineae bacterium]|nr:DinB family protein [Anaerolineae bacterium]
MIDFGPVRARQGTLRELALEVTKDDLRAWTTEMVDTMLALIATSHDEDTTFAPHDPEAHDRYAASDEEVSLPWTLAHVIVHTTASAEESAALAAELARGVPFHGRSRAEVPWQTVTTIAQCRQRLKESRRMRLASLEMWPDAPHLENTYTPYPALGRVGPIERFLLGLSHDSDHLGQIEELVKQAKAGRQHSQTGRSGQQRSRSLSGR